MAPVFIFAEQIQSIIRSGKKEIEIAAGARISSAAADLIKEHGIRVKTIALDTLSGDAAPKNDLIPAEPNEKKESVVQLVEKKELSQPHNPSAEISEDELEEIVSRVLERFNRLKRDRNGPVPSTTAPQDPSKEDDPAQGNDLVICRCEEITRGEIKAAIRNGMQTLNGIKRVTRAGMGLCQGQTCQQLVARILAEELNLTMAELDPTTARGPVRPLRLSVFASN